MLCGVWRLGLEATDLMVTKESVALGGAGEGTATGPRGSGEVLASNFMSSNYSG